MSARLRRVPCASDNVWLETGEFRMRLAQRERRGTDGFTTDSFPTEQARIWRPAINYYTTMARRPHLRDRNEPHILSLISSAWTKQTRPSPHYSAQSSSTIPSRKLYLARHERKHRPRQAILCLQATVTNNPTASITACLQTQAPLQLPKIGCWKLKERPLS